MEPETKLDFSIRLVNLIVKFHWKQIHSDQLTAEALANPVFDSGAATMAIAFTGITRLDQRRVYHFTASNLGIDGQRFQSAKQFPRIFPTFMPQNRFRNWSEQVRQKQGCSMASGMWRLTDSFFFPAFAVGLKKDFHAECASLFLGSNWISMFPHCLRHSGEKLTSLIGVRLNMKVFRGSRISNWNVLMGVQVVFYLFGISILFLADLNFKSSVAFSLWFLGRNVLISEVVCIHILFHWLRWLSLGIPEPEFLSLAVGIYGL